MHTLIVCGAGGRAKVVLATIEADGQYQVVGVLDDNPAKHGQRAYGYPVIGGYEQLERLKRQGVGKALVAVGDNFHRAQLAQRLIEHGFQLVTVIHPSVIRLRGSRLGAGTVVLPNAFIGADTAIGDGAIVGVGAVVGHDVTVGSWVHLAPRVVLAGYTVVGHYSFLGIGASVLPGVAVGQRVVVGAHAAVTRDLPDDVTAVGVPARIIKGQ
ncbi:MAG: acetyltransferase [Anaerolineae bacterium]